MRRRKQKTQRKIIIITSFILLISLSVGYAAFETNITLNTKGNIKTTDDNCFTISDNGDETATITDYDKTCGTKVKIPNKINNLTITKIADGTSIKNGDNRINNGPFTEKKVELVIFPNTITYIGKIAFFGDKLKKVTIPSSVKEIGLQAFAFNTIENLTLQEGLKTIKYEAFSHNNLKTVKIPNSVTNLGLGAFNTNLMSGDEAYIYNRNSDGSIDYTTLNSYGNRENANIVFPNNIKILGRHSLYYIDNLTEINIPDTVEELKDEVLFNNTSLKTINIGKGIKIIDSNAFLGIRNTEHLTININRKEGAIEGAPWGAENATIKWIGTN